MFVETNLRGHEAPATIMMSRTLAQQVFYSRIFMLPEPLTFLA